MASPASKLSYAVDIFYAVVVELVLVDVDVELLVDVDVDVVELVEVELEVDVLVEVLVLDVVVEAKDVSNFLQVGVVPLVAVWI